MSTQGDLNLNTTLLQCPDSGLPLEVVSLDNAIARNESFSALTSRQTRDGTPDPFGVTEFILVRRDEKCAYPIVSGFPVLLAPEMLMPPQQARTFNLSSPSYEEAYQEMAFYNEYATSKALALEATGDTDSQGTLNVLEAAKSGASGFPNPITDWVDARYDCTAQWAAYNHLSPLENKRTLQLGGSGIHAVKFLVAGAQEAWLLTPMIGEAIYAQALARMVGLEERLHCVIGVAEELPFASSTFDAIYSGGCIHHTQTQVAFSEIKRVLKPGGKFSAVDPWKAPLHAFGTRIFGKRETDVHCRPMTPERMAPLYDSFEYAEASLYGAIVRYPLLVLNKLGFTPSIKLAWTLFQIDKRICTILRPLRSVGSSVAILATKSR